ncbi:gp436 family protein [Sphingomonas panni]|uniref:gp436 family protein n=1 Tax=Sphingomonas panni TaxID=237612 RepID=UPI001F5BD479
MTYATPADLTERYGMDLLVQLADRGSVPTGVADSVVVTKALTGADATIDAALSVRYSLPLASVPEVVVDIALAIAIYKLHRFEASKKIEDEYAQALKDLDAIAAGRRKLDVAGIEPKTSGSGGVVTNDRPRDMTPDNLRGFV